MNTFLESILAFPTAIFTVLFGIVLTYWLLVIVGALGVDLFDGDADLAAGAKAAGGALEGGAKAVGGAFEGGAKALGGLGEGLGTEGSGDHADSSGGLFEALGFAGIPVTVSASLAIFCAWFLSLLTRGAAFALLGSLLPGILISGAVLLLSLVAGTLVAALAVRPLRPLFVIKSAPGRESLMGRVCTINSGSVTSRFGHATFDDGQAGLILNVFCSRPNGLKRGDQALILGYDPARDVYEVEPVDFLLPEELAQIRDPAKAVAIAARAKERAR